MAVLQSSTRAMHVYRILAWALAPSVSGSFISPWGRRFEYRPRGLINELQLILKNSPKRHFFVYKSRGLYTSKYGNDMS